MKIMVPCIFMCLLNAFIISRAQNIYLCGAAKLVVRSIKRSKA